MNTIAEVKARIEADWKIVIKFWSVRLTFISTAILSFGAAFPEQAYGIFQSLPYEVTQLIPQKFVTIIGISLYIAGFISRFFRQRSVERARAVQVATADVTNSATATSIGKT